jgi:hypothetical protein
MFPSTKTQNAWLCPQLDSSEKNCSPRDEGTRGLRSRQDVPFVENKNAPVVFIVNQRLWAGGNPFRIFLLTTGHTGMIPL